MNSEKEFDLSLLELKYRYRFKPKPGQPVSGEIIRDIVAWLQEETTGRVGMMASYDMILMDVNVDKSANKDEFAMERKGFSAYIFFEEHADMLLFKLTWG